MKFHSPTGMVKERGNILIAKDDYINPVLQYIIRTEISRPYYHVVNKITFSTANGIKFIK